MPLGADLLGLFTSAFAAATILPGGSEVLLGVLAANATSAPWQLLLVATLGNTLGGMTSWLIGRAARRVREPSPKMRRGLERVRRHGAPILLLSWVPLVGDALCVAAGWLDIGWLPAATFMAIGKAARYGAILWLFH